MQSNIITSLIALLCCTYAVGQDYKKEKAFNKSVSYHDTKKGYFTRAFGNKVLLYDATDYTLKKTIKLPAFNNYVARSVTYLSTNVFNTDPQLEFLVYYTDTTNQGVDQYLLMNIQEKKLKAFQGYYGRIISVDGSAKLIMRKRTGESVVYNLPGNYSTNSVTRNKAGDNQATAYPNPAKKSVTLQYSLSGQQTGRLVIYNSSGQQVDQYRIGPDFNKLRLDVSGYRSGTYFYKVRSGSGIQQGKFLVQ